MADVWVGKAYGASGFEKVVAIKLLTSDKVDQEEYQRSLSDEARLQATLKHPNIVDIYDFNFEAENPYLVMEYVEGIELRRLLKILRERRLDLPVRVAAAIVSEVAKALAYAHERGDPATGAPLHIVHRDISPSNILLSAEGDVKLSDFGIAKSNLQSGVTQAGAIKGKFRYMSPEQAEGRPIDSRSDIFSLGLVLYEGLFGRPAYEAETDMKTLTMARFGAVFLPPHIDSDLKRIFAKLLSPFPEDRYGDLALFRKDLMDYMQLQGGLADRDEIADFLKKLDLAELKEAVFARQEAEQWRPEEGSRILERTGELRTLEVSVPSHRRRIYFGAGIGIVLMMGVGLYYLRDDRKVNAISGQSLSQSPPSSSEKGHIEIETDPPDATVTVKYGRVNISRPSPVSLPDLPFQTPIEMTVSKKGYQSQTRKVSLSPEAASQKLKFSLSEAKNIQVKFNADPYAEVSVPGYFEKLETPTGIRVLPAGNYDITFVHESSGRRVMAQLKGEQGGSFLCTAVMEVHDAAAQPKASCRVRD